MTLLLFVKKGVFYPVLSVFIFTILILATNNQQAFAVSAGCYLGEGNGNNTYSPTQCPTEGYARAAGQYQACYVVLSGGTVQERDCNALENIASKVPESSSTAQSPLNPIDNRPIESDCEPDPPGTPLNRKNCGIINLLVIGINVLSAIAGMVIVASLMIAGFTYMTAQDNAGQTQKAKARIVQTLIALALFIFMYAFLNFLVPGGVLP